MKKIAIFAKVHDARCNRVAAELITWLENRGLTPLVEAHLARHLNFGEGAESQEGHTEWPPRGTGCSEGPAFV